MNIQNITQALKNYNGSLTPCSIFSKRNITEIEEMLGFILPLQYIELMKYAGGAECGKVFLYSFNESLGNMNFSIFGSDITYGPEFISTLFVKHHCLIIGTDDDDTYYFLKGSNKNNPDSSNATVYAFHMGIYDEYEVEDIKDIIHSAWNEEKTLFEFIMSNLSTSDV